MLTIKIRHNLSQVLLVVIGAIVLMVGSFYNGYPLVYSDTSTYLASGFELETPFDRPITYGLFIRLASLNGLTLWGVLFFQALILSFLIFQIIKLITGVKVFQKYGLITIIGLSLFTGLSWTVSQIMPDVFTPIGLLSVVLILKGNYEKRKLLIYYLIFFLSVGMHMSHVVLFSLLIILIFICRKLFFNNEEIRNVNRKLLSMMILCIASIITMGSAMSKSKHVFFMGSMVEQGILKQYLDENCGHISYNLCTYKDSLPNNFNDFVWKKESPLYRIGWKESKKEFNQIITATLTTPKYIVLHIKQSLKMSFRQLLHFGIGDGNGVFLNGTLLYERIAKYFPEEVNLYSHSRQSRSELNVVAPFNFFFLFIIGFSSIGLFILLFLQKSNIKSQLNFLSFSFISLILLSAWGCGTFSMVADRFGAKNIWLIPFLFILVGLNTFGGNKASIIKD